jgi:hypothetical protein
MRLKETDMSKSTTSHFHDGSRWVKRVQNDWADGSSTRHDYSPSGSEIGGVHTTTNGDQYETWKGSNVSKKWIGNDGRYK